MNTQNVVEQVQFRIKDEVLESDLIASSDMVNQWVRQQPGFMYRSLTKSTNGLWTDIVYWQDMECAKTAGDAFASAPENQSIMAAVIEDSVTIQHFDIVSQIGSD